MKREFFFFLNFLVIVSQTFGNSPYLIWSDKPATIWRKECYPIGNGRLGGMIFGDPQNEHIQFNEITIWKGGSAAGGTGNFMTFGDLTLNFTLPGSASNYRRDLDIGEAAAHVSFTAGGVDFKREFLASFPDSVIVIHLTANQPGKITFKANVGITMGSSTIAASGQTITASGSLPSESNLTPLLFEGQFFIRNFGGSQAISGQGIQVTNADSADILFSAGTSFLQSNAASWRGLDPHAKVLQSITLAAAKSYSQLFTNHETDYQNLFNRFTLNLNDPVDKPIATPTRVSQYKPDQGNDKGLEVLFTQYGRYLHIASSRNSLPANLQGLWNADNAPNWRGDYHSDINVTMNYSLTEPLNLTECFGPFTKFVDKQREVRHTLTQLQYPGVRGWTVQTETNPMGGNSWEWNDPANAWYCNLLWDHYQFTQDEKYLKDTALPILKEVSQFWQDRLVLKNGKLIAPNEWSPENGANGTCCTRQDGTAYAQQLIWDVFTNYSKAESILNLDPVFKKSVDSMLAILSPGIIIGPNGNLLEYPSGNGGVESHRHISHLVGLYPGSQISPYLDIKNSEAAKQALILRGDGIAGWSCVWRADCWARLLDGDKAYHQLGHLFAQGEINGNLLNEMFNTFQVDGNFGYASAVAEMLLQSQAGQIVLLPALPTVWSEGSVSGLKARGNYQIGIEWKAGKFTSATILAGLSQACKVRSIQKAQVYTSGKLVNSVASSGDSVITFSTAAGNVYTIMPFGIPLKINPQIFVTEKKSKSQLFINSRKHSGAIIAIPNQKKDNGDIPNYNVKGDLIKSGKWNKHLHDLNSNSQIDSK